MHLGRTVLTTVLALLAGVGVAGTQTITVTDHLNRDWQEEFVSYPLKFGARAEAGRVPHRHAVAQGSAHHGVQ